MLYSNFPYPIQATPISQENWYNFILNHQIIIGKKITQRILCSKITIFPGMNEDLNLRFTRNGVFPYIEKHSPDWADDDPTWNRPDQLFLFLYGYRIQTRLEDQKKFKRHLYVKNDLEIVEMFELLFNPGMAIFRIEFLQKQVPEYLVIEGSQEIQSFHVETLDFLKEQKINNNNKGGWVDI